MNSNPAPDPTHGLTVQHADALWDAVAIPGPQEPTFPVQHERVCRAVAGILDELAPAAPSAVDQTTRDRIAEAPAVWIDGHPQLEAIATAVWERCRTEDTSTVVDDPRNIAVAAFAAVLAVLPPPADRSAVLREAADICDEAASAYATRGADDADSGATTAAGALFALMERFQRKADEAEYVATPCDPINPCEDGGEPCHVHERLMAHAEGEHELCEPDCGTTDGDPSRLADEAQQPAVGARQPDTETGPVARIVNPQTGYGMATGGNQPASTAPLAAGLPLVQGNCPACHGASLLLGDGGYVTCARIDCPEPDAATTALEMPASSAVPGRSAATSTDEETARG